MNPGPATDLPPTPSRLQIIVASTRSGRVGGAVAEWIGDRARRHRGFEAELVDLMREDLPMLAEPEHPRLGRYQTERTKGWSARIDSADAFVFVSPEYNHGIAAPLKNAIDHLYREWNHKPMAIVSYGGTSAGLRAAQMLKQVAVAVRLVPIYDGVAIPFVSRRIGAEDGAFEGDAALEAAATRMFDELLWLATALRRRRETIGA
jgi:NAD(P)H-dependent FMN reductase